MFFRLAPGTSSMKRTWERGVAQAQQATTGIMAELLGEMVLVGEKKPPGKKGVAWERERQVMAQIVVPSVVGWLLIRLFKGGLGIPCCEG
jgi:hypothetical protein